MSLGSGVGLRIGRVAVPAVAEGLVVVQKDRGCLPTTLTGHVGERVRFSNEDEAPHNVCSESPQATFDLGTRKPGQQGGVTLHERGTIDVQCEIHPKMPLRIDVK